jgi:hypothetical protein
LSLFLFLYFLIILENLAHKNNNYEVHQINLDERVDEIDDFRKYVYSGGSRYLKSFMNEPEYSLDDLQSPIEGAKIIKVVEKLPDIQDFDETVAIVESVVIDHVSEDDKSSSSDEVTYEKWTEETKLIKTKIFKDGHFVDEQVEESHPELVGNIVREKLIERHEHIKHISQDVLKLVKVKSPGQSKRQSIDVSEILNEDLDGSNIIIVEPTVPSSTLTNTTDQTTDHHHQPLVLSKRRDCLNTCSTTNLDNVYYIQHQQIITPSGRKLQHTNYPGRKHYLTENANTNAARVIASKASFNLMHNFDKLKNFTNISSSSSASPSNSSSHFLFNSQPSAYASQSSITLQYLNKLYTTDFAEENFIKLNNASESRIKSKLDSSNNSTKTKSKYRSKILSLNKKYFKNSVASINTNNNSSSNISKKHNFTLTGVCTTSSETDDLLGSSSTASSSFLKSMSVCCDSKFSISDESYESIYGTLKKNHTSLLACNYNKKALKTKLTLKNNEKTYLNKIIKGGDDDDNKEQTEIQIHDCRNEVEDKINNVTAKSKNRLRNSLGNLFSMNDFDEDPNHEWTFDVASSHNEDAAQDFKKTSAFYADYESDRNETDEKREYGSTSSPVPFLVGPDSFTKKIEDGKEDNSFNKNFVEETFPNTYGMNEFNLENEQFKEKDEQNDFLNMSGMTLNNTKTDISENTNSAAPPAKRSSLKRSDLVNKSENSETTTSELESMERFERPSKIEMERKQAQKQKIQKELLEKKNKNQLILEQAENLENDITTPINSGNHSQQTDPEFDSMSASELIKLRQHGVSEEGEEHIALDKNKSLRDVDSEQYEKEMTENNSDIIELNTEMIDLISNAFSNNEKTEQSSDKLIDVEINSSLDRLEKDLLNHEVDNKINNNNFTQTYSTLNKQQQQHNFSTNSNSTANLNKFVLMSSQNNMKPQQFQDDMTDVSDDEQNIFSSTNLERTNSNNNKPNIVSRSSTNSASYSVSALLNQKLAKPINSSECESNPNSRKSRNLPLRRESFEMAQQLKNESSPKRLSISLSANENIVPSYNQESSVTSSSFQNLPKKITNEIEFAHQEKQQIIANNNNNNKRMLSEIKPSISKLETSSSPSNSNSSENEDVKSKTSKLEANKVLESLGVKSEISENKSKKSLSENQESDSSESSSNILKRNYEIIRKKTSEKLNRSLTGSSQGNEDKKHLVILGNENNLGDAELDENPTSYSSSNSLYKSKPLSFETAFDKPTKIKIIKKSNLSEQDDSACNNNLSKSQSNLSTTNEESIKSARIRSISPGLLRRGPDVIETIETTTSMSFIMNKNVNLIVEEKRTCPPFGSSSDTSSHNESMRLNSALSQPQLYQTKIDDLLNMADNLIKTSKTNRTYKTTHQNHYESKNETRIPITIQSRSKSEPKLVHDIKMQTQPSATEILLNNSQNNYYTAYDEYNYDESTRFQKKNNNYETLLSSPKNRVTFHKYDSNEIIAVVNVPQASYQTTTIESANNSRINNNRESINSIINSNLESEEEPFKRSHNLFNTNSRINNNDSFEIVNKNILNSQLNCKNFSKSVPNLNENETFEEYNNNKTSGSSNYNNSSFTNSIPINNSNNCSKIKFKLDSWKKLPEYIVDQETDMSVISNSNEFNSNDENNSIWIKNEFSPYSDRKSKVKGKNVEFKIDVEKRLPSSSDRTSVSFEKRDAGAKIYTSKDGRISIENIGIMPSNEIIIKSDVFNYRNELCPETIATRMSSGYFSGDEFRSYYNNHNNSNMIYSNFLTMNSNSSQNASPTDSANTMTDYSTSQFNINKFLNNKAKYKSDDALEEFNNMYKSLGLEEDDALLDRANARDYAMYGKINHLINSNNNNSFYESSSNINSTNNPKYRSRSVYDSTTDGSNTMQRQKSIFSRKSAIPDTLRDDMARVRVRSINSSSINPEVEKEFYSSQAYLMKSPSNYEYTKNVGAPIDTYSASYTNFSAQNKFTPDIKRDDASVLNINRKRSNSMTSINNEAVVNPLILPSPTSADYLRNRTRENALINVYMNPVKTTSDFEISQILYDDMAYRQLRKDSDACKLSQIKSNTSTPTSQLVYFPSKLTNITTLPHHQQQPHLKNVNYSDYYHQTFTPNQQQQQQSRTINNYVSCNESFNSSNSNSNNSSSNIKTVKMIKQKDATNKNLKQKDSYSNISFDENR